MLSPREKIRLGGEKRDNAPLGSELVDATTPGTLHRSQGALFPVKAVLYTEYNFFGRFVFEVHFIKQAKRKR